MITTPTENTSMSEATSGVQNNISKLKQTERLSDAGNAKRMIANCGEDIRWVPEFRKWILWNKLRWNPDRDRTIVQLAIKTAEEIYHEAANAKDADKAKTIAAHAIKSQSLSRIMAMIELAKSERGISLCQDQLDRNKWLLGVRNGVIDLNTGDLLTPCREDYLTKHIPVNYDLKTSCPIWKRFLNKVTNGNINLINFLQRAIGYSLTGDTGEQCLFFLHGNGANGKSTLLNTIKELMGDYAMQCPAETLMVKQGKSNASNDIARLLGTRFVATSETEDGRRFAESMIKHLTGQDTIAARFLFSEYFEFIPNFKIWLGANHKPVIRGDDYAIWRRIHLIPFDVTIPPKDCDKSLPDKLRNEFPGILSWAVQGCLEWQRYGLNPPPEVQAATKEYKVEMDLIGKWVEECCVIVPHATAKASELYSNYKNWVESNGGLPLSNTKFGIKLGGRGFLKEKSGAIIYRGIGLMDT